MKDPLIRKLVLILIGILFILWFFDTGFPTTKLLNILYEQIFI